MARVKFEISRNLNMSTALTPHIYTFKGHIFDLATGDDDEDYDEDDDDDGIEIGSCDGFVYEIGRSLDDGSNIFTQADDKSDDLQSYLSDAIDGDLTIRATIRKLLDIEEGIVLDRLLVIGCVEIYSGYRGKDLGLQVVTSIINTFGGGCDLTMLKAWPMQRVKSDKDYCKRMKLPEDSKEADKKLLKHWAKAGFRRIARTSLMVRPAVMW